jgi:hypothetical protein
VTSLDKMLLVIHFINLKINSTQFFKCVHRNIMYMYIFIRVSIHTYINIYVFIRS